jgi:transposase
MALYELGDFEWNVIAPILPNKPRGVPRIDDRRVLNGIFWVLCSGATCLNDMGHMQLSIIVSTDGVR